MIDPRLAPHCLIMKSSIRWIVLGCLLYGCGGNVTLGNVPDGGTKDGMSSSGASSGSIGSSSSGGSGGSSGGSGSSSSSGGGTDATAPNPLSGTYTGYIESFQFSDGSDVVVMNLSFANDGTVTGTVNFGSGAPLPPASDPDATYPPGVMEPLNATAPFEGFDFTALAGTYSAPRLKLSIDALEVWNHWCDIQTTTYPFMNGGPEPDGGCAPPSGAYSCEPNGATSGGGPVCTIMWCQQPSGMQVDCGKLQLCQRPGAICTCTATGCSRDLPATGAVAFDMQLAAGALDGSVSGIAINNAGQVYNVHLKRGP